MILSFPTSGKGSTTLMANLTLKTKRIFMLMQTNPDAENYADAANV